MLVFMLARMGKRAVNESDSDDSDEGESDVEGENEKSVVLNNGNESDSNKAEGSSGSVIGGEQDGESSVAASSESCSEEEKETVFEGKMESGENIESPQAAPGNVVEPVICDKMEKGTIMPSSESAVSGVVAEEDGKQDSSGAASDKVDLGVDQTSNIKFDGSLEHKASAHEETSTSASIPEKEEPLNFDAINSAAELEVC